MFSKINKEQASELWLRQLIYLNSSPRTFAGNYLFPAFALFLSVVASDFNEKNVVFSTGAYILYLTMTGMVHVRSKDKKKYKGRGEQVALSSLLKRINDLGYLSIIVTSIWTGSVYQLEKTIGSIDVERVITFFLCLLLLASLISSSIILKWKIKPKTISNNNSSVAVLLGATLGLGLIINLISNTFFKFNSTSLMAFTFASLSMLVFLPAFVWNVCEILFLGLKKWPEVYYTDSGFVVKYN